MVEVRKQVFNMDALLANAVLGRKIIQLAPKEAFFSQGDPEHSVFYLQKGHAKITVVSAAGKEATLKMLSAGAYFGEAALAANAGLRLSSATALTHCTSLEINRTEMLRLMHDEPGFSELFLRFVIQDSLRSQADLADQLFNSSEKRLARTLLLMASHSDSRALVETLPRISQETLAEMIGTTRSRVSFFMNRFRKLGLIDYKGRIQVHRSRLNLIVQDGFTKPEAKPASFLS